MKKATSKPPIKEPLLRLPAQSIDEQIDRLFKEKVMNYALFALVFFLLALIGWIQAFHQSPFNPRLMSFVAVLVIAYCAFRFWQALKEIDFGIFPRNRDK